MEQGVRLPVDLLLRSLGMHLSLLVDFVNIFARILFNLIGVLILDKTDCHDQILYAEVVLQVWVKRILWLMVDVCI